MGRQDELHPLHNPIVCALPVGDDERIIVCGEPPPASDHEVAQSGGALVNLAGQRSTASG